MQAMRTITNRYIILILIHALSHLSCSWLLHAYVLEFPISVSIWPVDMTFVFSTHAQFCRILQLARREALTRCLQMVYIYIYIYINVLFFLIFNLNGSCLCHFFCNNFVITETSSGANAHTNTPGAIIQASVPGNPVVSVPATNLNIGMDLWNASPAGAGAAKVRANPSGASSAHVSPAMMGREGVMPDQWVRV